MSAPWSSGLVSIAVEATESYYQIVTDFFNLE